MIPGATDAVVVAMVDKLRRHDSWAGQTHLQKALYICEQMLAMPLGLDYQLHHYGPFSRSLEQSIQRLVADSALTFVPQPPPYGPRIATSEGAETIRHAHPDVVAQYDEGLEFVATMINRRGIRDLERIATALWMIEEQGSTDPDATAEAIRAIKDHISHNQGVAAYYEVHAMRRLAAARGLIDLSLETPPKTLAGEPIDNAPLIVDTASVSRRLRNDELGDWARMKTVFVSSEMQQLGPLRRQLTERLTEVGFTVLLFEDLGGRDENAEEAYLDGVRRSDIYLGVVGDRYGSMGLRGHSATHEEYLEARRTGKRISVWVARDGAEREGHARSFVQEVQTFHTTGQFADADDLSDRVVRRLAEIAADDEAPWIKIGTTCFRAGRVRDHGERVVVIADIRTATVARALEDLRPVGGVHSTVSITTAWRTGKATIREVIAEQSNASRWRIEIQAHVEWQRRGLREEGASGDALERTLRHMLLGKDVSQPTSDLLARLKPLRLPHAAHEGVARLLLTEWLAERAGGDARIERFAIGPRRFEERHVELVFTALDDIIRAIDGIRPEPDPQAT